MLLTQRAGVVNTGKGDVSGRSLANLLSQKDKRGFVFGENQTPMYDAARFSQAFAPIVGDSGTATRMPIQGAWDLVSRLPMNIAARAYTSTPAVEIALRAQAASHAGARSARRLGRAMADPGADAASAVATGTASAREQRRRRALAEALARNGR
jgi:hypothetical protein